MTAALAVAAPQWRIGTDRSAAARTALAAGADELHLDFGGAHRGALLCEPGELRTAMAFAGDIPVPVLAVNHVNDIGLARPRGVANAAALALVERALECASSLGARVLHIPGFRRSLPYTEGMRAGTVEALRVLCGRACAAGLTLAYESPLGPGASLALARAVDRPELRLVLDTGNLLDAGEVPMEFAASVGAAGLLLPDLHVKDPARAADSGGATPAPDELRNLLRRTGARSVLVENDYRCAVARLRTDITLCRTAAEPSPFEDDR
ncbi:sugar phosphate isomerase/epimerase family protein [Streptomyces microflavus]|uniref:sugar phosphate isomerase/epimerase family protein n=1 Tax=Streptomyces microflavus TaxID=1919 RepID=UPI00343A1684